MGFFPSFYFLKNKHKKDDESVKPIYSLILFAIAGAVRQERPRLVKAPWSYSTSLFHVLALCLVVAAVCSTERTRSTTPETLKRV